MTIRKTTITLIALIYLFVGCKNANDGVVFEKEVLIEVIPSIVDSICHDPRIFLSPPPMLGEFKTTKDGHVIIDTTLATHDQKIRYKIWLKKQDALKTDTSKIYLAINPKIKHSTDSLRLSFAKHFNRNIRANSPKIINDSITIDINPIALNKKFKFKNSSQFTKSLDVWNKKYNFIFSGFFNVSRILFDESKTYGILSASYTCGGLCGEGHIIYIKKVKGKWIIDKIEGTWIA
ncbi:MAG: hypothetical protein EOP00_08505 [Pedobacter sp.]|nr:MAG: hypothetical protein EOP00_08505 [Pedobacter sp.]